MSLTLYTQILTRTDTAANWTGANPTLGAGELGLESDTFLVKKGDGATAWTSLPYVSGVIPTTSGAPGDDPGVYQLRIDPATFILYCHVGSGVWKSETLS